MALEKNQILFDLNDKIVKADTSSLNSLGNDNKSNLEILSNRIGGVLDGAGDDNWADEVRSGITTSMEKIKSNISTGIAASEFISGASQPVENLKLACKEYVERYNEYVQEVNKNVPQYKDDNKTISDEYMLSQQRINAYENSVPQIEIPALNILQAVKNYFAAINLETNKIDSSLYVAGSADFTFDFGKYFNGIMEKTKEEFTVDESKTTTVDNADGSTTEHKEGEYKAEYSDGSVIEAEREQDTTFKDVNNDGVYDEQDELILQKVHDEGTFTDADGNVYGYVGDESYDEIGLISKVVVLTDQETGDDVYKSDTEREAAYENSTGSDVVEYSNVEETEDASSYTRTITTVVEEGSEEYTEEYKYTVNNNDQSCGTVQEPEGTTYTYYRDENNVLHEVKTDGNRTSDKVVNETNIKTFTITDGSGNVVASYQVNLSSRLDRAKMIYDMEQYRIEAGIQSTYSDSGANVTRLQMQVDDNINCYGYTFTIS